MRIRIAFALLLLGLFAEARAFAFTHVVKPGETLALLAGRVYGDPRLETVLVGANALDAQGGSAIVPGMALEIPAPGHHRVAAGETWPNLALTWLGDSRRGDVLARANHAVAWVPPVEDLEIEIPAVLTHLANEGDTSTIIAQRYLGDGNRGWELNAYNGRAEVPLRRGEIMLVPLADLTLTEAGRAEARQAFEHACSETDTAGMELQRRAETELPALLADIRGARYIEAVARGNRVLGTGDRLTKPQLAIVHRALLEAYVALEATGAAAGACTAWRANDPNAKLDSASTSPKIRAVCRTPSH